MEYGGRKYLAVKPCTCRDARRAARRIEQSGLGDLLGRYTFEAFQTIDPWQKSAKELAENYARDKSGWMVACGSVGAGKTHLCTAVCGKLLADGVAVRYMLWRDDAPRLKAAVTDGEEYERLIKPLKAAPALYIDDLFKGAVSQADVNLAFELLNSRYNDAKKLTIISTEKSLEELLDIDEAIGSRIYERSRNCRIILRGNKNWRLRDGQ
jgi:DNA replication protein DnaC